MVSNVRLYSIMKKSSNSQCKSSNSCKSRNLYWFRWEVSNNRRSLYWFRWEVSNNRRNLYWFRWEVSNKSRYQVQSGYWSV